MVVAGTFVLFGPVAPARASCAPPLRVPDAVAQSDVVVVGTVTATRSRGRIATVSVDELWKGKPTRGFEVYGGPAKDNMATSVDRTYVVGARYLVFAYEPAAHGNPSTFGGTYEDNNCSATQPWKGSLTAYRPADATVIDHGAAPIPPESATRRGAKLRPWLVAGGAVALLASGAVVRSRRTREHKL